MNIRISRDITDKKFLQNLGINETRCVIYYGSYMDIIVCYHLIRDVFEAKEVQLSNCYMMTMEQLR